MRLFYQISDCNEFVYHYTKLRTFLHYILPQGKLRFSKFANANDPLEYKNWVFDFGTRSQFKSDFNSGEILKNVSDLMKHRCRMLCCTVDSPESVSESVDNIYDRGFCRSRMWAQYADCHSGVCLIFNRKELNRRIVHAIGSNGEVFSGRVIYKNRPRAKRLDALDAFTLDWDAIRLKGFELATRQHFSLFYRELFLQKASDWADEREFRWLVHTNESGDWFLEFGDSLRGVLIGDACPLDGRYQVYDALSNRGIPLGVLNWKSGIPEVLPSFRPMLA